MNDNFVSALNKVTDIGFKSGRFVPEGQTDAIDYTTLVLRIVVDGNVEEIPLSGASAIKPKLLKTLLAGVGANKEKQDFLETPQE